MYKKAFVYKSFIRWEQKYNELKKKYDKLAYHIIVNKINPNVKKYSGHAMRIDVSIIVYPTDSENKLSYKEFINHVTSKYIENEFMKMSKKANAIRN